MPKTLSSAGVKARSLHDQFVWMMFDATRELSRFDAGELLCEWWAKAFGGIHPLDELNEHTFDEIRKQLLFIGYGRVIELKDTNLIRRIKSELIFED